MATDSQSACSVAEAWSIIVDRTLTFGPGGVSGNGTGKLGHGVSAVQYMEPRSESAASLSRAVGCADDWSDCGTLRGVREYWIHELPVACSRACVLL